MIRVCHLSSVHSAIDVRIFYKECKSLAEAGYEVTLVAMHDKPEEIDGVRIVPFPRFKNRLRRFIFSPFVMFYMALKQNAMVYHFHDPELIFAGIMLKLFKKKVIYDVHEDVAGQALYKYFIEIRSLRKLIVFFISITDRLGTFFFDRIITVTENIARKFRSSKTIVVRNMPILKSITGLIPANIKKEKPIIVYSGGLTQFRGIKQLVKAMEYVGNSAELWLMGKWESDTFFEECEDLKGWCYTQYKGFLTLEEVYSIMKMCDIGVVPFLPLPNHVNALPNKVFEYMACALPIVMSDFSAWKRMFNGCALFIDPEC